MLDKSNLLWSEEDMIIDIVLDKFGVNPQAWTLLLFFQVEYSAVALKIMNFLCSRKKCVEKAKNYKSTSQNN